MKQELADLLLSTIMDWDIEGVVKYREHLEDLADLKYDHYQQYRPGGRFLENLAIWLNHFKDLAEREIALNFLLKNLIFISPLEMNQLVSMVFPDSIKLQLKEQSRRLQKDNALKLSENEKYDLLNILIKESLFLGLSDGARIDVFRRSNPELNHEQICLSYEIPDSKYDDITDSIKKNIEKMNLQGFLKKYASSSLIKNIFLIDDFSASGISFIRKEEKWKGKISKLLESLINNKFNLDTVKLTIILYIATEKAINYIKQQLSEYQKKRYIDVEVQALQIISPYTLTDNEEALFKKYFDNKIIDSHYKKGKIDKPYLGFDECSLSIVLYHNTPNNSFPIIWGIDEALFPRITRHKDV